MYEERNPLSLNFIDFTIMGGGDINEIWVSHQFYSKHWFADNVEGCETIDVLLDPCTLHYPLRHDQVFLYFPSDYILPPPVT